MPEVPNSNTQPGGKAKLSIPKEGLSHQQVLETMRTYQQKDARWQTGQTWSLVYFAGQTHSDFIKQAHNLFMAENALNPGAFPSLARFENEVVSMTASLLGGDEAVAGTMTSGGTESIFLVVKTYRDYARHYRPEIKTPEIVLPVTAHPAFDKACHYLDVIPVFVPLTDELRVDLDKYRQAITSNTIFLVASAPSYPHGTLDPVEALGQLALEKELPLHVDGCLGGFMLPWLKKLGYPIAPFDFSVPGVTSLTADLHKYAYAAKGASVVLYRNRQYRRFQFYVTTRWPGGIYPSSTAAGTRPGGPIAAAWAALQAIGENGYLEMAQRTMAVTQKLKAGISALGELQILGNPVMSVFAYTSPVINIYAVADQLEAKGWLVDRLQHPAALHLMVTLAHEQSYEAYLNDLKEAVEFVKQHPKAGDQGKAAVYGMLAQSTDPAQLVETMLRSLDKTYDN